MFGVPTKVMKGVVGTSPVNDTHHWRKQQKQHDHKTETQATKRRGFPRLFRRKKQQQQVPQPEPRILFETTALGNFSLTPTSFCTGLAVFSLFALLAWSRHQKKKRSLETPKKKPKAEKSARKLAKEAELLARQAHVEAPVDAPWMTTATASKSRAIDDDDDDDDPKFRFRAEEVICDVAATIMSGCGFLKGFLLGPLNYSLQDLTGLLGNMRDFVGHLLKEDIYQEEMRPVLMNHRFWSNFQMLFQLQQELDSGEQRRSRAAATLPRSSLTFSKPLFEVTKEDAQAYMKYSTAAYGDYMMQAAQFRCGNEIDKDWARANETLVSTVHTRDLLKYLNLKREEDVFLKELEAGGKPTKVGFFCALDHERKAVVLAIRGTFSLLEVVTNLVAMTRTPSWAREGEAVANEKMAYMADQTWKRAGNAICAHLDKYSHYSLIVTGHSLGAGVATLLTIKLALTEQDRISNLSKRLFCYAFASPPVYCEKSGERKNQYAPHLVNIVHQQDVVPFLSVWSIRYFFQQMRAVDDFCQSRGLFFGLSHFLGNVRGGKPLSDRYPTLRDAYKRAEAESLRPVEGSDLLSCPAAQTLWLRRVENDNDDDEDDDEDEEEETTTITTSGQVVVKHYVAFDVKGCTPQSLTRLGVCLDQDFFLDHLPPDYEHALQYWDVEEDSQWIQMSTLRRRQEKMQQNGKHGKK